MSISEKILLYCNEKLVFILGLLIYAAYPTGYFYATNNTIAVYTWLILTVIFIISYAYIFYSEMKD